MPLQNVAKQRRRKKVESHSHINNLSPLLECLNLLLAQRFFVHLHLGDPAFEEPSIIALYSHSDAVLCG